MKRVCPYIVLLSSVFFLISCTEEISLDLDSSFTRLVVYGEITTDTMSHEIRLSYSSDYLEDKPEKGVENALVTLGFNDTKITLSSTEAGIYRTPADFYGIAGTEYHLEISNLDVNEDGIMEYYDAKTIMNQVPSLDSIDLKYTKNSFFSAWEVMVYAQDPAGIKNFYSFKVWKNGVLLTDTITEYFIQNDDLFDGNYTYGISSQFLDDSNPTERALPGDTITFQMDGINEGFFWFITEAQIESFGANPLFSGPPANIKSNLSNGALGYFTAYSIDRKSMIVPEYPD